jgi:hypothetical protein
MSKGWGGEMSHATMPRAILAHTTLQHWYKIYCVCRILLKWRIVIFSSQNVIMAHCYSFILEFRIVEDIVEVMGSMKLVSDLL